MRTLANSRLAARNRRAACQAFVAVGRLPVLRRFELRALKKPYPAEIGLVEVGVVENGFEKIGALEMRTREIGTAEIDTTKIGVPKVGAGKIDPLEVQAAKGAAGKVHGRPGLCRPPSVP